MRKLIFSAAITIFIAASMFGQKVVLQNSVTDTLQGATVNTFASKRVDDIADIYITAQPIESIAGGAYTIGTAAVFQGSFDGTNWFSVPNQAGDEELLTTIDALSGGIYPFGVADYYRYTVGISATDTIRATVGFTGIEALKSKRKYYGSLTGSNGLVLDSLTNVDTSYFAMPRVKGDHVQAFAVTIADHTANIASTTIELSVDGVNYVSAATAGETVEAGTPPDDATALSYVQSAYPYVRMAIISQGAVTNLEVSVFGKQYEIK